MKHGLDSLVDFLRRGEKAFNGAIIKAMRVGDVRMIAGTDHIHVAPIDPSCVAREHRADL